MQLDPAVAKTRPSNFSPVVLRMLGFTSSDAGPCDGMNGNKFCRLSKHSSLPKSCILEYLHLLDKPQP